MFMKESYRRHDEVVCVNTKLKSEVKYVLRVYHKVIPLPLKINLLKPSKITKRRDIIVHVGIRPVRNSRINIEVVKNSTKERL